MISCCYPRDLRETSTRLQECSRPGCERSIGSCARVAPCGKLSGEGDERAETFQSNFLFGAPETAPSYLLLVPASLRAFYSRPFAADSSKRDESAPLRKSRRETRPRDRGIERIDLLFFPESSVYENVTRKDCSGSSSTLVRGEASKCLC